MKKERRKIAVPITDSSQEDILHKASLIQDSIADMVEWRVDYYQDVGDLDKVLDTMKKLKLIISDKSLIFTFRTKGQGGNIEISHDYYMKLNILASESKVVDLIDIEMDFLDKVDGINIPIIGSYHNFKETPSKEEILSIFKKMESKRADILKVAVMAQTPKDVLTLLDVSYDISKSTDKAIIAISMGELGKISRVAGHLFGSSISFASLGDESAPGQISLENLLVAMEKLDF